jgi:hypothetical protein
VRYVDQGGEEHFQPAELVVVSAFTLENSRSSQNPAGNPTGTVAAVTYRTAEALRDRYFNHPGEIMDWGALRRLSPV